MTRLDALLSFIEKCPSTWATCPIYALGTELKVGVSDGKVPFGEASKVGAKWSPSRSALAIERDPETFQAFGVFTGTRSDGLVIFDVDYNLGAIQKKWGKDLNGPRVVSTKKNAAKYLFIVPEKERLQVAGLSHTAANSEGFEVLWGRQGIVFGAYGGHAATNTPPGHYEFEGDITNIPIAPSWLLERMKDEYRKRHEDRPRKRLKDTKWSGRTREEKTVIIENCLSVLPHLGAYSEDHWWHIGAAINDVLPGEDGLRLWENWSKQDPDYAWDWSEEGIRARGGQNPCQIKWSRRWRQTGDNLGLGSLITWADEEDPERKRFQRDDIASLVDEIESKPQRFRQDYIKGEELLIRALDLEEEIEDPALLDQEKTVLALEAGRAREGAIAIDRLLDAHLSFKRNKGGKPQDVGSLDDTPFEYLIPGLLPKPWLLLIHADGGTGKSAMCQTLCKHISQGKPFNVHGGLVDIKKGKCLWLNGDQSERITRRQFNLIGVDRGVDVVGEWDMAWYRKFCRIQGPKGQGKYDLIIIDSLDGCNDSNPYEENRREYALPLKRLARRNGEDFGACSIIVIHHNNRNGGFRGTSAIKAAVDETWNMNRVTTKELAAMGAPFNSRVVTVEKSRDDREGQRMLFSLLPDYTYSIGPVTEKPDIERDNTPNQHMLRILQLMREERKPWSVEDLVEDDNVGGKHKRRAIRYALSKLAAQQLITKCDPPKEYVFKGRPPAFYIAEGTAPKGLFSTGSKNKCVKSQTPSTGADLIDKDELSKGNFVKSPSNADSFDKPTFAKTPIVNKNSSTGTLMNFDSDIYRHRESADSFWDS